MKNICIISSIGFFTLGSISSYLFSKLKTKIVGNKKTQTKAERLNAWRDDWKNRNKKTNIDTGYDDEKYKKYYNNNNDNDDNNEEDLLNSIRVSKTCDDKECNECNESDCEAE